MKRYYTFIQEQPIITARLWLKQTKTSYEGYVKRNKADIAKFGNPMPYDEWIYKQILCLT